MLRNFLRACTEHRQGSHSREAEVSPGFAGLGPGGLGKGPVSRRVNDSRTAAGS
jgi:hypothetical protein